MSENKNINYYQSIDYDVRRVYEEVLKTKKQSGLRKRFCFDLFVMVYSYAKLFLDLFLVKAKIRKKLIESNLLQKWFNDFNSFWSRYLNGRPIDIIDFHFLRLNYRCKFQTVSVSEQNEDGFIKSWQRPECIYLLFGAIWKYCKSCFLDFMKFYRYLPRKGNILEYGCGIAPVTTGLLKYFGYRKYNYYIADILQINFVYAIWNLAKHHNVHHILLDPFEKIENATKFDLIVCITVFEHIPNPLEMAECFYEKLNENGVLVFDFIKGEGIGLDSVKSVVERNSTLKYILDKFKIKSGKIDLNKDVGLVVAQKK